MACIPRPAFLYLHWLLAIMLVLPSACAPSSPKPTLANTIEPYSPSGTPSLVLTATTTQTPVPPSRWALAGTVGFLFPPTVDPSTDYLPVLLTQAEHFSLSNLSNSEQANVYAAVIRRLAGPDDSFGGTLLKPFLFILTIPNDHEGDRTIPTAVPQGISPELQRAIQDCAADLPSEIKWVNHREEVKIDPQHLNVVDGVILTLGNILIGDDQRLYVAGSLFYTYAAATGLTYIFEWRDGQWVLVGRTNLVWIA
jgi:hypothetical protein